MGRNDIAMVKQLGACVEHIAGKDAAREIMQGSAALKVSSSKQAVTSWVRGAMERLAAVTTESAGAEVMRQCGHFCAEHHQAMLEHVKARRSRYATLEDYLASELKKPASGIRFERDGNTVNHIYCPGAYTRPTRCFCGLMKGLPQGERVPAVFCQCSRGFVEKYWEGILGYLPRVKLLSSAVTGSTECRFAVRLSKPRAPRKTAGRSGATGAPRKTRTTRR